MALELTDKALKASQELSVEPQLVLQIDGVDTVFGAVRILKVIRIGDPDLDIGNDWVIGGLNEVADQEDLISVKGTGTSINQQLRPDLGSVSSVSSITVELLDSNNLLTQIISPGVEIDDIMDARATLYFGFAQTAWKDDYVKIFAGIIDDVVSAAGTVQITLSHPDQKKRQTLFLKAQGNLTGAINNSVTNIPITDADTVFLQPYTDTPTGSVDESLTFYVKIDDELIQYTGASSTNLTGAVRGALDTTAASHESDAQADSFFVLEGTMIDLVLKLMLSGVNGYFKEGLAVSAFNVVTPAVIIPNALFFRDVDVTEEYGLVAGDYITTTGAADAANNVELKTITTIVKVNDGSYILVDDVSFINETESAATVSLRSQYDTLGFGCAMTPQEVDVEEHHYWRDLYLSQFQYRFYIKDEINAKEFIEKEIYAPFGAYSVPRKTKASVGYHIGPIPRGEIAIFDRNNIKNPSKLKLRRTTSKYFYNTVIYKFDESPIEDKFLSGQVYVEQTSKNRIKRGTKPLIFDAKGVRSDLDGLVRTAFASERYLGRYRFAAEHLDGVQVFFKDGFTVEPGDLAILDPEGLKVSNTESGNREKPDKFFEVINKSTDLKTGNITVDLVDTSFESGERFGIISPSSTIVSGTTSYAIIQDSYGDLYPGDEQRKWLKYIGLPVLIHSEDFSFSEEVVFTGFDAQNRYKMLFDAPLSEAVQAGWIIDIPNYSVSEERKVNRRYKLFHPHFSPDIEIVSAASDTVFDVGVSDASKFEVGFPARVHNDDFSIFSPEVLILDISGTTITVDASLGFTPVAGQTVSLLGFPDSDHCYRWI